LADDDAGRMTAAAIRASQFTAAKGFGRGYDSAEVDRTIARCADAVEWLSTALIAAQGTVAELRARLERESSDAVIEHAVNVLTTAQETADKILAHADEQRERAEGERRAVLAEAADAAGKLQRASEHRAKQVTDAAARRVAALEQDLARMTGAADIAQEVIDREADRLRAVLQAGRTQLDDAIDGILQRVAEQYGRAQPVAAQAAISRKDTTASPPTSARNRRGLKLAGRPTDRRTDLSAPPGGAAKGLA
jgi:vacuolar-type H+-ATPase subunit E/Vma4